MSKENKQTNSHQGSWARFRFSVVGALLASPPESGELKGQLKTLAKKQWRHPITDLPVSFSASTIERWFYHAKKTADPIKALRKKRREDAAQSRALNPKLKILIQHQQQQHPCWSCQLHLDNLAVLIKSDPELGPIPSYSTLHRYRKANGLHKQRRVNKRDTEGALQAQERLEKREIRSFEVDHVNALWHLDFHHGSRKILGKNGQWYQPQLLCILDDHSRLVCHIQWVINETTDSLVHGFKQALQKRGLPRALMSDNGAAMTSAEFIQGLERLGILHQTTLPYSPYQNAKQEVFWVQIEGRLMAMLDGEKDLTLALLNEATIAWVEFEYHRKLHSEIAATPLDRYLKNPNVGRPCPNTKTLNEAFCEQVKRKQRRSDGTVSLHGCRFEIPSQYRHMEYLSLRCTRWDLSNIFLVDPCEDVCIATLYPVDKSKNANTQRRAFTAPSKPELPPATKQPAGLSPLIKKLMADYAATGLPPAYLPQQEKDDEA